MECNIYFNTANIEHFSSEASSSKKYVLYFREKELKCIPIDQTSFLERLKAWFGYGPLSLHRIANTIADNCSDINNELDNLNTPQERIDFYVKLNRKRTQYNNKCHHYMHYIPRKTLDHLFKSNIGNPQPCLNSIQHFDSRQDVLDKLRRPTTLTTVSYDKNFVILSNGLRCTSINQTPS